MSIRNTFIFTALFATLSAFNAQAEYVNGELVALLGVDKVEGFSDGGECKKNIDELAALAAAQGKPDLGYIRTIAFSNWWMGPTLDGRVIVNCLDKAPVMLGFMKKHGNLAKTNLLRAASVANSIKQEYNLNVKCDDLGTVRLCAEGLERLKAVLEIGRAQGFRVAYTDALVFGSDRFGKLGVVDFQNSPFRRNMAGFEKRVDLADLGSTLEAFKVHSILKKF